MGRPRKNTQTSVKTKVDTPIVDVTEEKVVVEKPVKPITKPKKVKIDDDEEIEVEAFDSNVSYWDKLTDETYFWENVGDIIALPYSIIKNMWRNHKTYFRNFLLKPNDERVVSELGLDKTYEKYDFLVDGSQYTKDNIDNIIQTIKSGNNGFKSAIFNNIKNMIVAGDITDVSVIIKLGKAFDIDFIDLAN